MGAEDNRIVVRGTYESFERGDMDPLFAAFASDIVWVNHTPSSTFYGEHKGEFSQAPTTTTDCRARVLCGTRVPYANAWDGSVSAIPGAL